MSNLQTSLQTLANEFVSSIVGALRAAPLDEILSLDGSLPSQPSDRAPRGRAPRAAVAPAAVRPKAPVASRPAPAERSGRRYRASAEEVASQKKLALDTAKTLKPGFSKGDVMRKSGSDVDLGRALTLLVADGKLRKQGERRMTRYWVR